MELIVNGTSFVPKSNQAADVDGLKPVLIRSYAAGVFFGLLDKEEFTLAGKVVVLKNARRLWYWKGAASLSQIAVDGVKYPNECKFPTEVESIEIVNVIETIPLTTQAFNNLKSVPVWKQ